MSSAETRPKRPRCDACRFYRAATGTPAPRHGNCHRRPPVADYAWLKVRDEDWCGDFRKRKRKP